MKVKDDGVGFEESDIPALFQKFSQLPDSINLNPNGVGLSLYICKGIISGCGGEIEAQRNLA